MLIELMRTDRSCLELRATGGDRGRPDASPRNPLNNCLNMLCSHLRPISPLTFSLLRLIDSSFPGNSLWAWEFHPLKIKVVLESNPLKSIMLVRRLAVVYRQPSSPERRRGSRSRPGSSSGRGHTASRLSFVYIIRVCDLVY